MQGPERGDLVTLDFTPQAGHEQDGRRPALVLSPKNFNDATGFAVVCPITQQEKGYPFEVKLPDGLHIEGVVLTDQVKSIDWQSRQLRVVDNSPADVLEECLELISTFLVIEE